MEITTIKSLSLKIKKQFLIFESYFAKATLVYILLSICLSRTFSGIYVFGLRWGEIIIATAIIYLFFFIFSVPKKNNKLNLLTLLVFSFFVIILYRSNSLINPYTYKTSSYIWTLAFLVLGSRINKINFNKNYKLIFSIFFIYLYLISVFGFPKQIQELFISISDKFELHKGSDLILIIVILFFTFNKSKIVNSKAPYLFIFFISLYIPLLLYKSRASFIACLIFTLIEVTKIFWLNKFTFKQYLTIFLLFIINLTSSTLISQKFVIQESDITKQVIIAYKELGAYRYDTFNKELPLLYIKEKRLYSSDGNLDWRIQMWQDMIDYMNKNKDTYVLGFGYGDKLPVFYEEFYPDAIFRIGLDGLNEHLHNFWLTILARGGLFHLFIFIFIYIYIFREIKSKTSISVTISILMPILFVAFFDSAMENAHFSVILYFFLGNQFLNVQNK